MYWSEGDREKDEDLSIGKHIWCPQRSRDLVTSMTETRWKPGPTDRPVPCLWGNQGLPQVNIEDRMPPFLRQNYPGKAGEENMRTKTGTWLGVIWVQDASKQFILSRNHFEAFTAELQDPRERTGKGRGRENHCWALTVTSCLSGPPGGMLVHGGLSVLANDTTDCPGDWGAYVLVDRGLKYTGIYWETHL